MNFFPPEPWYEKIRPLVEAGRAPHSCLLCQTSSPKSTKRQFGNPFFDSSLQHQTLLVAAAGLSPEGLPSACPSDALFLSVLFSDQKGHLESDIQSKGKVRLESENNSEHTEGKIPVEVCRNLSCLQDCEHFFSFILLFPSLWGMRYNT